MYVKTLTRTEARKALSSGLRLTHYTMPLNKSVKFNSEGLIVTQYGPNLDHVGFWKAHEGSQWMEGWAIVK